MLLVLPGILVNLGMSQIKPTHAFQTIHHLMKKEKKTWVWTMIVGKYILIKCYVLLSIFSRHALHTVAAKK